MSKSRIFLFFLLSFIAGVGVQSFIGIPYEGIFFGCLCAAAVFSLGIMRRRKSMMIGGMIAAFFVLGAMRLEMAERAIPDTSDLYGRKMILHGLVAEDPERKGQTQGVVIRVQNFSVLATMKAYPQFGVGDEIEMEGTMKNPKDISEGYASFLRHKNITATLSFPEIHAFKERKGYAVRRALNDISGLFEDNIAAILPEPHAAFLKGLLLGRKESLPDHVQEEFQRAGASHLLALSGYNITVVGRLFVTVLSYITSSFVISFWAASSGIVLFVLLTGAAPSLVRAAVMGILLLIAQKEGRGYRITNALIFAAAVMVAQNPFLIRFDAGFQLSFLATVGLIYVAPMLEERFKKTSRFASVRRIAFETMSAQIMVLPLVVYLFGSVSVVSPLANLAVLFAVPYAMFFGFIASIAEFIWHPAAMLLGIIPWALLGYMLGVIAFFSGLPFASVSLHKGNVVLLVVGYGVLMTLLIRYGLRRQQAENTGLGGALPERTGIPYDEIKKAE